MKLLFLLNVLAQFVVLNHFLGPQYTFWGFGILNDILNGRQWQTSGHFPRVCLYCLLSLNVSRWPCVTSTWENWAKTITIGQCNAYSWWTVSSCCCWTRRTHCCSVFNEKIFIFLWFWFLLVAVLTTINLCYWLVISYGPGFSSSFVERYLVCFFHSSQFLSYRNTNKRRRTGSRWRTLSMRLWERTALPFFGWSVTIAAIR